MNLFFSFISGGRIVSLLYYLSNIVKNPALATIVRLPTPILVMYFLDPGKITKCYTRNFSLTVFITALLAALIAYLVHTFPNYSKNKIIGFALVLWVVLQISKYFIIKNYFPKFHNV